VSPIHAEISRIYGALRLKALEDGVTVKNGKPLAVGKSMWLYHGKSFTIGNTTFTYIEKDI
jgi:predicted component of type VI protein secretion system